MAIPVFGPAGQQFWDETMAVYSLSTSELLILTQLCNTLDTLAGLDNSIAEFGTMITGPKDQPVVHPAVVEARGQRIVLHRLTAALALPDASGNAVPSARSASSAASNARRRTARLIERTG